MDFPQFSLKGKVAIVTGGSQGIGEAISSVFAAAGASVCVVARNIDRCNRLTGCLNEKGYDTLALSADVTRADDVKRMLDKVISKYDRTDILVNCAGGSTGVNFKIGRVLEVSEQDWDNTFTANVKSVLLCSRAVAKLMIEQKTGNIINIASITGRIPFPGMPAYSAAKAAVISLTKSMALEFAPYIRVNAIAPGLIETARTSRNRSPEQVKHLLTNVLLGRMGTPDDVAVLALYLASDTGSWNTGNIIDINGGQMSLTELGRPYFRD